MHIQRTVFKVNLKVGQRKVYHNLNNLIYLTACDSADRLSEHSDPPVGQQKESKYWRTLNQSKRSIGESERSIED